MKRAIDKTFGAFIAIVVAIAGFSVLGSLVAPYMGWIVAAVVILVIALAVAFLSPASAGWVEKFKNRNEDPWEGSGN